MTLNCKSHRFPWPGLPRPSTPCELTYSCLEDVGARIKSGHGALYARIEGNLLPPRRYRCGWQGRVAEEA
jgi:hypothetical protein